MSQPAPTIRTLHSFTVSLDREVTETTVREENGQKITVESKVTKPVDYTIILKEPNRTEKTDLSLFKDVTYGQAIKAGLVPKLTMQQLLAKMGANNPLSEEEDKSLGTIKRRIGELGNEYQRLSSPTLTGSDTHDLEVRKAAILQEWAMFQKKALDMDAAYQSVYEHTAENYTQSKMLTWLALFLTYVKDPAAPEAPSKPLFPGADFAAKEQALGDLEDAKDQLFSKAMERIPTLWWLYMFGRVSTSDDFKQWEEEQAKEAKLRADMATKLRAEAEGAATVTPSTVSSVPDTATPLAPEPVATVAAT